jgi:hypothetical protein
MSTTSRRRTQLSRPTRRTTLCILVAAVSAVALVSVSLATASSGRRAAKTLHYGVRFVNDAEVDLGAAGPSVGDERTFYDVLVDRRGRRAGYAGGVCTIENFEPPVFSCTDTFSLRGGQIATQFLTTPGPAPKPLAITGGTGRYRGAHGEATLVEFGPARGRITFKLTTK